MVIRATYHNKLKWLLVISDGVLVPLCPHGGDNMECNIGSVTKFYLDKTPELIVRGEANKKKEDRRPNGALAFRTGPLCQ
ncbi:uncharacterized protein EAF01_004401 [Botrytis porri]|uniref:uncharacterized protein n=1 Tax=Botrytis porri TaxID=87229 RepID=UPI001901386C|nr:uncharacterized protein EAF01_004401 [Botrytis porri]KAF7908646.1 hypothetical protein EAF01_004401 [Botrytis porri]